MSKTKMMQIYVRVGSDLRFRLKFLSALKGKTAGDIVEELVNEEMIRLGMHKAYMDGRKEAQIS